MCLKYIGILGAKTISSQNGLFIICSICAIKSIPNYQNCQKMDMTLLQKIYILLISRGKSTDPRKFQATNLYVNHSEPLLPPPPPPPTHTHTHTPCHYLE